MKPEFRILLVNAVNPHVEVETRYPPLGLAYLAASVRRHMPEANIVFKIIDRDIRACAESFRPHLAGISSVSQNFGIAEEYADYFASRAIPVVMGGIHITFLPECLPESATLACLGESEVTFVEVVRLFLSGSWTVAELEGIAGIAFRKDGKVTVTAPRPLLENLDDLPLPARDLLPIRAHAYMFTSRGCPFDCTFCASKRFWRSLRFFSAAYVVGEIRRLRKEYNVSLISFFDDLFVADRARLREIIRLLEQEGLLGAVRFTCSCRANLVDEELAALLARLGVVSVGMGLESGDDDTLRFLKGGTVSVAANRNAVAVLKKAGIAVNASFVIGSPQETKEQILRTYRFIRHSDIDLFDIYLLTPFPGTPVWEYAEARGLVSRRMRDWAFLDVNTYRLNPRSVISLSQTLRRDELLALYAKFRRLRMVRNACRIFGHPFMADVPRMAVKLLWEYGCNLVNRRGKGAAA